MILYCYNHHYSYYLKLPYLLVYYVLLILEFKNSSPDPPTVHRRSLINLLNEWIFPVVF